MKRIVVFDAWPWEAAIHVGNHAYVERFLRDGARVLYVSMPHNLWRMVRNRFDDRDLHLSWKNGPKEVVEDLWQFTPLALLPYVDAPLLNSIWVGRNFHRLTVPNLERTIRNLGFSEPDLVWIANIRMGGLISNLGSKKTVFRLSDNPWAFAGEPASSRVFFEDIVRSHTTIATAHKLYQEATKYSENVHYVPNGYEPGTIRAGFSLPEPKDIAGIPHPRAVYVGVISHWFDIVTLSQIAALKSDWHFVLVGPVQENHIDQAMFDTLCGLRNIHCLGPRDKEKVGAYLRYCDVGLIPFVKDDLTDSINPIKLYEYAACGLSIVSRDLDEVERIGGSVELYQNVSGFRAALDRALADKDASGQQQWASVNTWDARYAQVKAILGWG